LGIGKEAKMSESQESEFSKRLRRLPGQLLLALVNGTAVLVIAAAVLAIIASSKVTHLAQNVASTMTDAVLSRVDGTPRQVLQNLQGISDEVHTLLTALQQAKVDGLTRLDPEVARLNERLSALEANIKQLHDARSRLVDEAIAKVASSLSEGLQNFRACPHGDVQSVQPVAN
jgi:flagellar motility protein MotE (MotC chaperone)